MTIEPLPDGDRPRHAVARRPRLRTAAIAVIALLLADVTVGIVASRRDVRENERRALERTAAQIEQHDSDDPTMVVFGTENAQRLLDPDVVAIRLGPDTLVRPASIDGSMRLWRAAYHHAFVDRDGVPDVVVIAFLNDQLTDQRRTEWAVIGRQYTAWRDVPDAWSEAPDVPARLDLAASRVSALVGHRAWLASLWSNALPNHGTVPRREAPDPDISASFEDLASLLDDVTASGATPMLVALPTLRSYELDPALVELIDTTGTTFVDLRIDTADPETDLSGEADVAARSAELSDAVFDLFAS